MRLSFFVIVTMPLMLFGECDGACDVCSMSMAQKQIGTAASEVRPFSITGTVTARSAADATGFCRFFLYDQTGLGEIFCNQAIAPMVGKIISVRGVIAPIVEKTRPVLIARSIVEVGAGRLAPPLSASAGWPSDKGLVYRTLRVNGCVRGILSSSDGMDLMTLASDGHEATVMLPHGRSYGNLIGATVSLVGVRLPATATDLGKPCLILTEPESITVISPAPVSAIDTRILLFIISLLTAVILIVLTRTFLLRRMSKLRIGERTRLAVELHDSLSQNLAAVAMQISSARSARRGNNEAAENRHLTTAEKMLDACRNELRHCLWDLRSDTVDLKDFSEAIRKTLSPLSRAATISVNSSVPRAILNDSTAHAALMILRELSTNAIVHGKATSVTVCGSVRRGVVTFSVRDDGVGFNPKTCPGLADGHFGLEGIRQRLKSLRGTLDIDSEAVRGTVVTFTIGTCA